MSMNKKIVKVNVKKLEDEKKSILERMQMFAKAESPSGQSSANGWVEHGQKTDENAAEVAEYADNISLQQSMQDKLASIETALEAIRDGSYGTCSECGNPVEEARLSAMPTATWCIACKKKKG